MVRIVRRVIGNMIVVRVPEAVVNTRAQVVVGASPLCLASRSKVRKAERLESLLYALSSRQVALLRSNNTKRHGL